MLDKVVSKALAQKTATTGIGSILGGPVGAAVGGVAESILSSAFGGNKGPGFQTQLNDALTWQRKTGEMDSRLKWQHAKDAQKYGFHPLAGLGINPASGTTLGYMRGDVASSMGQNISRAIGGTIQGAKQKQLEELALERARLENDLIRAQISDVTSPGDGPGYKYVQNELPSPSSKDSGLSAGAPPAFKEYTIGKHWRTGETLKMEAPWSEEGISEAIENLPTPYKEAAQAKLNGLRALTKPPPKTVRDHAKWNPGYKLLDWYSKNQGFEKKYRYGILPGRRK